MAENVSDDPRLDQLLERWEDLRDEGREASAEDLCREFPNLLAELKQRIACLKAMDWLLKQDVAEAQVAAEMAWHNLPKTLGRYRLDELIGTGGFGQVWKGFDPELQRPVAIKVPRPDRISLPDQAENFLEEARKVAQLRHPGIVPVHDVGREGDWFFIVADYIEGGNLSERISRGRLGWRKSAQLVADVAEILHHAHELGFVHRDIKPANILLDNHARPYLTDFGIALSGNERHSGGTETAGTLAYMSPEQLTTGAGLDRRSDIYSLGVVFYELLTGQRPFTAKSPLDLRKAVLSDQPTPPRSIDSSIPVPLEQVCLKVLAKEPAGRYPTAAAFAVALRAAARPRRRPMTAMAIGLALIGLLIPLLVHNSNRTAPSVDPEQADPGPRPPFVATETPTGGIVDLLPLIDPEKDTMKGHWSVVTGVLHSDGGEISHIKIPYELPEEYSLAVVATRKSRLEYDRGTFGLGLVGNGQQFLVQFDIFNDTTRLPGSNVMHRGVVFKQGKPRTIVCTCRRDTLTVEVDGKKIIEWQGDYASLSAEGSRTPDKHFLRIVTRNNHFAISKIELRALSGTGNTVR